MTTLANLLHIAAIERPQTIYQAMCILFDWLHQIGIEIDNTEIAKALPDGYGGGIVQDNDDYKHLYLNSIIGNRYKERINDPNLGLDSYAIELCNQMGKNLSRKIFGHEFAAHKFLGNAIQMIYQFGYLPDIKQMAQDLLGTPDVKFLRNLIKWSKENTNQVSVRSGSLPSLLQSRFFDPSICANIRTLSRYYGIDKIVNLGKTRPDDLFLVATQMDDIESESQRESFGVLIKNNADIDTVIGFARQCKKIQDFTIPPDPKATNNPNYTWDEAYAYSEKVKQEFAAEFRISAEEYEERYQDSSTSHLREDALDRLEMVVKDTQLMLRSVTHPSGEIAKLAADLEANIYPDVPDEIKKKFFEYRNRILKIKLPKLSLNFDSMLKLHDEVSRYQREVFYCKKIILKEPILKFPPPLISPLPPMITYIDNEDDLMFEGESMRHCVSSYGEACASGYAYIYHYENGNSKGTIELSPDGAIKQFYGYHNATMGKKDWEIVENWVQMNLDNKNNHQPNYESVDYAGNEEFYANDENYLDDDPFGEIQVDDPRRASLINILRLSSREWFGISDIFEDAK